MKAKHWNVVVVVLGFFFAISRVWIGFAVDHETMNGFWGQSYKDFAHIYIGLLFGLWMVQNKWWHKPMFWALCFIETVVAIASRL